MPQKFTFPTIQQAISLQKAESMEDIKVTLRNLFNQNPALKISQNVAWSFKICHGDELIRRYIHCKFCPAKIIYIKNNMCTQDKLSNTYKLSKFYLHHDHRLIQSVRQKGKVKTFPQHYAKVPEFSKHSIERQRKKRSDKLRRKREECYKYKKLELYYRLGLMVKDQDKDLVSVKQLAAKSLGTTVQRFMNFLNSPARAAIQVSAIKKLLKRASFEKYNVEMDTANYAKSEIVKIEYNDQARNSEVQKTSSPITSKAKGKDLILEESKQFFKNLMIFVNYNEIARKKLQESQGLINITHFETKILSKKFMSNIKWDCLLFYSHDQNFTPNQLYAIIMIDSSRFTLKQIKKSFQITFKLLDPLKKLQFQCCIHQENIHIMGALDLIIEQIGQKRNSQAGQSHLSLNYFLSPKLSTQIINKCEFVPKIFRKKLIQKIHELDPKEIDAQFQKIITELEKASQIKEYKAKTEEYLAELKEFYENFHKIFLGKIPNPSFVSLIFTNFKNMKDPFEVSMDQQLSRKLSEYAEGNKYFLEFLILIFDVFRLPGGSFIYKWHQGSTRQSTKVEEIYTSHLVLSEYEYIDEIKRFYNARTFRGKYEKLKNPEKTKLTADFFDQFSAIIYERLYKIRQIYMKATPEVMTVLVREIQKSFTLQVQTKTIQQIKSDGVIRVKQANKEPNTIKVLNFSKFWPSQKQLITKNSKVINLTQIPEKETRIIELENTKEHIECSSKVKQKDKVKVESKKLWQCDCNLSKFTLLPCSHEIRCCLTFFTSIEDQVDDFWLYDPKVLYLMQEDDNKSGTDNSDNDNSEKQNNSESD